MSLLKEINRRKTVGGIIEKPRIIADNLKKRKFLTMTKSLDHKVVDAALAARFINKLSLY